MIYYNGKNDLNGKHFILVKRCIEGLPRIHSSNNDLNINMLM